MKTMKIIANMNYKALGGDVFARVRRGKGRMTVNGKTLFEVVPDGPRFMVEIMDFPGVAWEQVAFIDNECDYWLIYHCQNVAKHIIECAQQCLVRSRI